MKAGTSWSGSTPRSSTLKTPWCGRNSFPGPTPWQPPLTGNLVPGDTLTYLTGMPYDTLQHAIGLTPDKAGTLIEKGVKFSYVPLKEDGSVDFEDGEKILKRDQPKIVAIQRVPGLRHPGKLPGCQGQGNDRLYQGSQSPVLDLR